MNGIAEDSDTGRAEKNVNAPPAIPGDEITGILSLYCGYSADGIVACLLDEYPIAAIAEQLCAADVRPDEVPLHQIVLHGRVVGPEADAIESVG